MIFSGLWMFEAYTEPVYEVTEVPDSFYINSVTYNYTAPVTESNPLYPVGAELEMGKPAYFFAISPTLDMTFTYQVTSSSYANLSAESETMIVATAKGSAEGGQKVYWQKKFPLKHSGPVDMKNGDILSYDFSLDVPEAQAMVKSVQDQLKYSQNVIIEVVTYVSYEGKINGEDVSGVADFPIPLTISQSYYQLPEKLDFTEDIDTYKTYRVKKDPSLSTIKLPLAFFLFNMVMLGILFPFRKMEKVDPAYIEKLEKEKKQAPFKDFVSKGKLPEDAESLMKVEIASLQDLTDAAVDINARVIHDEVRGAYFIIHGGTLYIYQDATSGDEAAVEEIEDSTY